MENFGSLIVIGAIVSALVQWIKTRYATQSHITLAIVAAVSIAAGTAYYAITKAGFIEPFLAILGFSGAVYTFIIQRFEAKPEDDYEL